MNFLQIMQLIDLATKAIVAVEARKKSAPGKVKKEEVKALVLSSTGTAEALGKLSVTDRKAFNKHLDKMIDSIVGILNTSEWK